MQEAATASYQELARRYGLEATPPGVLQLTQLVARQDCTIDEIASVISREPEVRARLLRVANPNAEDESDYTIDTVEDALMRNGIGCALLLAMGTPLVSAIVKTFHMMLATKLERIDVRAAPPPLPGHLVGRIGFSGKAAGRVCLRLSMESAACIARRILGLEETEDLANNDVADAIGELLNIATGNFKSNLCDAGLDCRLQPPQVESSNCANVPRLSGSSLERMAFRAPGLFLFVDVEVNPWNDD